MASALPPDAARLGGLSPSASQAATIGIHKIKHIVIIMQENRSFDSYFGTYPGADGIPRRAGRPAVACRIRCERGACGPSNPLSALAAN